jgi:hypothetical protein
MPDFSVNDTFSASEAYVQVKIGNDAKILEVELNELQKIQAYRNALVGKMVLQDGFKTKGNLTVTGGVLTVPADTIIVAGEVYEILEPMTISVVSGNVVYLALTKVEVSGATTLRKSGNLSGGSVIPNYIYDARMGGVETARRVQAQVQLTKTTGAPNTLYLLVCSMTSATVFVDNRTKSTDIATANQLLTELKQYTITKSNKDANFIYTTYERKRYDGTLIMRSILSGGTSPLYTTRTETWYGVDGTTVLATKAYAISYDVDGIVTSEV